MQFANHSMRVKAGSSRSRRSAAIEATARLNASSNRCGSLKIIQMMLPMIHMTMTTLFLMKNNLTPACLSEPALHVRDCNQKHHSSKLLEVTN